MVGQGACDSWRKKYMIEYLFFTSEMSDKFIVILEQKGVAWEKKTEDVQEAICINVSEDIDDALWDELDVLYDDLSDEEQLLLETSLADDEDDNQLNSAGIYIQLEDGSQTIAKINPDVMNRMLSVIDMEEFNDFIEAIVSSVEKPDDSAICQKK
jgi:hypothetical protein